MTRSILNLAADFQKQLAATVAVADTTCTLSSYTDSDGVALQNNRLYGFTVDTGSKKEYIIGSHLNGVISGIVSISRQGAATSGFSKSHQVGASVFITDWAALSRITNLLAGVTDFDSGVQLKYDGAPAQTEANAFATIQYVLDTASGSTVLAFNPLTIEGQATNVASGDWVYFDEATGLWEKTDADASGTSVGVRIGKARGTVSSTVPAGIPGGIFIAGSETVGTYTAGQAYYLSNTAGALSTSAGTNSVLVGYGDENGDLVMAHTFPLEITAAQKDALVGTSGTPSSTNKYVTDDDTSGTGDIPRESLTVFDKLITALPTSTTLSNTTTETSLGSVSIPGGLIGTANAIEVEVFISSISTKSSGSTNTFAFKVSYGSSCTLTLTQNSTTSAGTSSGVVKFIIIGSGATNTQGIVGSLMLGGSFSGAGGSGTGTTDSTSDQTLSVTVEMGDADASNSITTKGFVVRSLRKTTL